MKNALKSLPVLPSKSTTLPLGVGSAPSDIYGALTSPISGLSSVKKAPLKTSTAKKNLQFEKSLSFKDFTEKNSVFTQSISSRNPFTYYIRCIAVGEYISQNIKDYFYSGFVKTEIQTDENEYTNFVYSGNLHFSYNSQIYSIFYNSQALTITVSSNKSVDNFIQTLINFMKTESYLSKKMIYVDSSNNLTIKNKPKNNMDDLILDKKLKEDIYLNTVDFFKYSTQNNGIIFYGPPGTGKSLICSSLSKEFLEQNITVFFITTNISFNFLEELMESFVTKCVIIIEDIDGIGTDRTLTGFSFISSLLQFINGITTTTAQMLFLGTTNYIDRVDKALSDRPMRFNRKYFINYPSNEELKLLFNLYFSEYIKNFTDSNWTVLGKLKLTGAHVNEMKRTFDLFISKEKSLNDKFDTKKEFQNILTKVIDVIKNNFSMESTSFGFTPEKN